jgi:ATP-dependent Lon protease
MTNIHNMKTRSKSKDNDIDINELNETTSNDTNDMNDTNSDSDNEYEELDDSGNLKDFIDDDLDDYENINELKRKRLEKDNKSLKKSKTDLMLPDLLMQYIVHRANTEMSKIKKNVETDNETDNESDISDSNSDISEPETYKLDKYDKQFELLNNKDEITDVDINYFSQLNVDKKENILSLIKNINDINDRNIPLKFKIYDSNMDINTKSIAISQIEKINELDPSSGEYGKVDQWINGLIKIPFQKYNNLPINDDNSNMEKNLFLKNTNNILNKAIYGHKEAKSHILQVISKWIKNPQSSGNILALQGPMGNGKTTLVKEGIAKAINRPFAFITLGGASDSSFFDGHNFTYEGSKWGRIVEILIESKCMNPIFYFDELDKVSETQKGDEIIHLLTHLTDTSQNDRFQDNYFSGVNLDLSKALFIFSFNDENKIDKILKDRMHVIHTKGFKTADKIHITNDYLLPELLNTYKYHDNITFDDKIIECIIENYTQKEEGVRNLKRCLENIVSKVNMYELLYDDVNKCCSIDLDYKIDDFCIPYIVKKDDLDILLKKNDAIDKPPEHMYA